MQKKKLSVIKVQQVAELINGELMNSPAIGSFEGYTTHLENVQRGMLFFAINPHHIDSALQRGAFGVVFDKFVQTHMNDEEIAWIKVESIPQSIVRLIRYELMINGVQMFALNPIQYAIAHKLIRDKNTLFFDDTPMNLLDALESAPANIIATSPQILDLALECTPCSTPQTMPFDIITPHPMFESKFYYKLHSYQIPLPSVFLPELAAITDMCVRSGIAFDFAHFEPIASLLPISLAQDARIVPFGSSNRVIIPTNDKDIFLRYAKFLNQNAKWARIVMLIPTLLSEEEEDIYTLYEDQNQKPLEPICYDSSNELPILLKTTPYNFGLIFGISTQGLAFVLAQNTKEYAPALF